MAFINDLGKIIVFLFLLLSFFLITAKSNRKLPDYLFAAFLLVSVIDFSGFFIPPFNSKIISGAKIASVLLQMPLYYLYVNSAFYYNFKLQKKHLLHGIPFLVSLVLLAFTAVAKQHYWVFEIASTLQYYGYILAIFLSLSNFKRLYQENYSSNHYLTYKWLMQTTILFIIGNLFVLTRGFLADNNPIVIQLYTFTSLYVLFVISWFVLNALYRPNLFAGIDKDLEPKYSLDEVKIAPEQLTTILQFMATAKPYLDDQLTLQKLAAQVNLPEKQLSQLINDHAGKHFFDFINQFRIDEAKTLLKDSQLTVLEVLYQVGFNSKSSFYTAFKKETKTTPTDYRKSIG